MQCVLRLLGTATYLDQPLTLERALYLVALLVCQDGWVARDELMLLLWSDEADEGIKARLRQLVYRTKQMPYGETIESQANQLRFIGQSDVPLFRQAVQHKNWQQAIALYRGELLHGAFFDHATLEEWFAFERATLAAMFRLAVLEHASTLRHAEAAELLEQAMLFDPLNEDLIRHLLHFAKAAPEIGQRAFERFERELNQQLQLEPPKDIVGLLQALTQTSPLAPKPKRPELPTPNSAFIGRQAELEQIQNQLSNPHCRLLTLVGVGGIGKTRLALELALRNQMPSGAIFVQLAPLQEADLVANAILEALGERPSDQPMTRLDQVLASQATLLVLDNFEHVMAAREVVSGLLAQHSGLQILVTSRERLGLQAEFVFELGALPAPDTLFPLESQDAALLFIRAAQRSSFDFGLHNSDIEVFSKIYQRVAGMPLGLELAASWVRTLSLPEIVEELESSLDLLSLDAPDMPERHRSFAGVFNSSWRLLSQAEQNALAKLSIFQGGFDKDMANQVAGATLQLLLRLVNKSLVTRRENRFVLHELIRQYSQMYLIETEKQNAMSALAAIMQELSSHWMTHAKDEEQTQWSRKVEQEHDNIRSVLSWATVFDHKLGALIAGQLEHFWYSRGYHREGQQWAKKFLERYSQPDLVRLNLLWTQISLSKELSEYDLARSSLTQYRDLAEQLEQPKAQANAEKFFGLLEREQGNLELGKAHLERAKTMFEDLNDTNSIAICINDLGIIYAYQNNLEAAKQHFEESLLLKRQIGDKQGIAYAIGNLGAIAGQQGDYDLEKILSEQSLHLKRELGDQQGIANALHDLGMNALNQNQIQAALIHFAESLEIYQQLERRYSMIFAIHGFASLAHQIGQLETALRFSSAALHHSYQIRSTPPKHWQTKHEAWRHESQLSPAQLAKLEFETEKLSIFEITNQVLLWKEAALEKQLWQPALVELNSKQ